MRLWHKNLIDALPDKQLKGQWRECCAIAANIEKNGSPNHMLVNKIMDYGIEEFIVYGKMVCEEMELRGYKADITNFLKHFLSRMSAIDPFKLEELHRNPLKIFKNWHNEDYMDECYYNLREKYHCGGISDDEWARIKWRYCEYKAEHRCKGNQ